MGYGTKFYCCWSTTGTTSYSVPCNGYYDFTYAYMHSILCSIHIELCTLATTVASSISLMFDPYYHTGSLVRVLQYPVLVPV